MPANLPPVGSEVDAPRTAGALVPADDLPAVGAEVDSRRVPAWDTPPTAEERATASGWDAPPTRAELVQAGAAPEDRPDQVAKQLATADAVTRAVDPEHYALALQASHKTGVPVSVTTWDPQAFLERRDWRQFAQAAPRTATFLAKRPTLVALAKDDLEQLSDLEWALTGGFILPPEGPMNAPMNYQPPVWWEAMKKGWAGVRRSLETTRRELGLNPAWTQILYPFSIPDETEEQRKLRSSFDLQAAGRELHAQSLIARGWVGAFETVPNLR